MKNTGKGRISGHIVDVVNHRIFDGVVVYENGKITAIEEQKQVEEQYIVPGLVDAHVHIESSLLTPAEFARMALVHGTIACVCDPHEIANVCGVEGVDYMIENGKDTPLKFVYGVPSCVPCTDYETAGAKIDAACTRELMERPDLHFLAEMMNYPGVLNHNKEVWEKLRIAREFGKPVDGHAPQLSEKDIIHYAKAGISTDHETRSLEEAQKKLAAGMKIQIREGSAARDFDNLYPLLFSEKENIMLCTDDKHPDDLLKGHMDLLVRKALEKGVPVLDALTACTVTPVNHYGIPMGLLQPGDPADFLILDSLDPFHVKETYVNGICVAREGEVLFPRSPHTRQINNFHADPLHVTDIKVFPEGNRMRVISVRDGELYTTEKIVKPLVLEENVVSDLSNDVLKIVVYNRYTPHARPAVAFIHNFGLKRGALASSISHDSHNLIAIGTNDRDIVNALNIVISHRGGLAACHGDESEILPLPIGGLMSDNACEDVATAYHRINQKAHELGSPLHAPYLTMAFMSLPVIPILKLTDKGLFDVSRNKFTSLFIEDHE